MAFLLLMIGMVLPVASCIGTVGRRRWATTLGDECGSETLGQFKHLWINSKREMPILDGWIEDCSASLK